MKKIFLITSLFLLLFLPKFYAQQCSDHDHSLEQRVKESNLVIEGKIINQESYFDETRKTISTRHEIEVYKIFKGNTSNILVMHTKGGTVGNSRLTVSHQEHFSNGQESIFFLKKNKDGKIIPNLGTITFCPEYFSHNASDFFQSYPDIELDLYGRLRIETGQPFRKVRNNSLENSIEGWLSSVNMYRDDCQTILEYAIRNKTVSYPYFEFDITAKTNLEELYLKNTKIVMEYASSLGSNFVLNGKIEVSKDELVDNVDYILQKSDVTAQKFAIDIENPNLSNLKEIKQYEKRLCHVRIEIVTNSQQASGTVSFDNLSMEGQSAYLNPEVAGVQDFNCVSADGSAVYSSTDFTFYPDTVNAGISDTLYIVGNDFGQEGKVYMRNASQTNPSSPDYFAAISPDRVEWLDNLIKVEVLSLSNVDAVSNPASGRIRLELADSTIVENSDSSEVEVFYSIANLGEDERRINLANKNDNGGYTFHLGTELSNTPNTRAIVERVLEDWHEKTCINFSLATETIDNPSTAPDSLNLIFFDSTALLDGVLMQTFSNLEGSFFNGSGVLATWVNNIDIIIAPNPSKPWYIDLDSEPV